MPPSPHTKAPDTAAAPLHELICAWCHRLIRYSPVRGSHGACEDCYRRLLGLPHLTPEQLDELPFGVIFVDAAGTIFAYNRAESELSGCRPSEVIGRNFFRDIAPCTRVKEFEGHFHEFLRGSEETMRFDFIFRFAQAHTLVRIVLVRLAEAGRVAITVNRARA